MFVLLGETKHKVIKKVPLGTATTQPDKSHRKVSSQDEYHKVKKVTSPEMSSSSKDALQEKYPIPS